MTLIGMWQDLAMIWVWLGALLLGGPQPHKLLSPLSETAAPTMVNISKVPAAEAPIRHCTYLFEGTATSHSILRPYARVMVRLTSPHGTKAKESVADAEGRYSLTVDIDAARHEPVDWSMQTDVEDGLNVEVAGRRIVMDEDRWIVVHNGRDSAPAEILKPAIRYTPSKSYEEASVG